MWSPAWSRLLWLPVHASVIVVAILAIAERWIVWWAIPALSPVIAFAFAGLMFLGHEVMHGAIVRGRRARLLVGGVCFAPLVVSPHLWTIWHNRMHHAHANHLDLDPDMYPSLARYRSNAAARFAIDHFAPAGRRWRGLTSLVIGFTVQSLEILIGARAQLRISAREHRYAIVETITVVALWSAVAVATGALGFVFAFVLPLLIANAIVMAFILTNHTLCPANDTNDPLLGALSVTTPGWIEWLTLHFGYHVEHHLFPAVSARHARAIRAAIVEHWPERYQAMPIGAALARVFATGRVYQDATTLLDPRTGHVWPTLSGGDHALRGDPSWTGPPSRSSRSLDS